MLWWWRESIFLYLIYSRTYVDQSEHNQLNIWEERETDWILEPKFGGLKKTNSMWVQIQRYFSIVLLFLNSRQVEEGKGKQRDNQSQKTKHCFILGKVIIVTTRFHSPMDCNGGAESKNQNSCFSPLFCRFGPLCELQSTRTKQNIVISSSSSVSPLGRFLSCFRVILLGKRSH